MLFKGLFFSTGDAGMKGILLIVISLVVWRLTHLLTKEDGPFHIIYFIRKKAGAGFFGNLLDCFYCLSIWTALPFGIAVGKGWKEMVLLWLAFSGAACLLEKITTGKSTVDPPEYFED